MERGERTEGLWCTGKGRGKEFVVLFEIRSWLPNAVPLYHCKVDARQPNDVHGDTRAEQGCRRSNVRTKLTAKIIVFRKEGKVWSCHIRAAFRMFCKACAYTSKRSRVDKLTQSGASEREMCSDGRRRTEERRQGHVAMCGRMYMTCMSDCRVEGSTASDRTPASSGMLPACQR